MRAGDSPSSGQTNAHSHGIENARTLELGLIVGKRITATARPSATNSLLPATIRLEDRDCPARRNQRAAANNATPSSMAAHVPSGQVNARLNWTGWRIGRSRM